MTEKTMSVLEVGHLTQQFIQLVEELRYKREICCKQELTIQNLLKEKLQLDNKSQETLNDLKCCKADVKKLREDHKIHMYENLDTKNAEDFSDLKHQLNASNEVISGLKKEIGELQLTNHQKTSAVEQSDRKYKSLETSYDFMRNKVEHLQCEIEKLENTFKSSQSMHNTLKTNINASLSINKTLSVALKHKDCIYDALNEKKIILEEKVTQLESEITMFKTKFNDEENPKLKSVENKLKEVTIKYDLLERDHSLTLAKLKETKRVLNDATCSIKNSNKMILEQSVLTSQIDDFRSKYQSEKVKFFDLQVQLKASVEKVLVLEKNKLITKEHNTKMYTEKVKDLNSIIDSHQNKIDSLKIDIRDLNHQMEKLMTENCTAKAVPALNYADKTAQTESSLSQVGSNSRVGSDTSNILVSKNLPATSTNEGDLAGNVKKELVENVSKPEDTHVTTVDKIVLEYNGSVKDTSKDYTANLNVDDFCKLLQGRGSNSMNKSKILEPRSNNVNMNLPQKQKLSNMFSFSVSNQSPITRVKPNKVTKYSDFDLPIVLPKLTNRSAYMSPNYASMCNSSLIRRIPTTKSDSEPFISTFNKKSIQYCSGSMVQSTEAFFKSHLVSPKNGPSQILPVIPDSPPQIAENGVCKKDGFSYFSQKTPLASPVIQTKRNLAVNFTMGTKTYDGPKVLPVFHSSSTVNENSSILEAEVQKIKKRAKKRKLSSSQEMVEELEPCTQDSDLNITKCAAVNNLSTVAKFSKDVTSSTEFKRRQSEKFSMRYCRSLSPVEINDLSDTEGSDKDFKY